MNELPIQDNDRQVTVQGHQTVYRGAIWNVKRDTFTIESKDTPMTREYIQHPGAVAIVAVDTQQRIAMIKQYRHPVRQDCWEIPAGLLDVDSESLVATAQRELAEETDLIATDWSVLVDHYPSGGSSSEAIRIFLAQDLKPVPKSQLHTREAEEHHLVFRWVHIDDLLDAVMAGDIGNTNAVAGILAADLVVRGGRTARHVDAPFR
ncbi:MAG TPA: NUDIX hydrolase [Candidatus Yaniella excrementavium]|nr:NUDIX hydrolase [Candidatus Yaniella excrementavium]